MRLYQPAQFVAMLACSVLASTIVLTSAPRGRDTVLPAVDTPKRFTAEVTACSSSPDETWGDPFITASGREVHDLGKKLATMRTVVGSEVLRYRAGTSTPGVLKEGDFPVIGRVKIKPGMGDEYLEMARSIAEPMMKARVAGGELKSWSLWSRVFPSGAATSYDALSVTYFKDMASATKGLDAAKGVEAFQKTHPGKSYGAYVNNGRDYSELQQRFVMQVIALVERAQ